MGLMSTHSLPVAVLLTTLGGSCNYLKPPSEVGLQQQNLCAIQVLSYLDRYADGSVKRYKAHYNRGLNKCFAVIDTSAWTRGEGRTTFRVSVVDVFENNRYGEFMLSIPDDVSLQPKLLACLVTLPNKSVTFCNTKKEFTSLVQPFMEN